MTGVTTDAGIFARAGLGPSPFTTGAWTVSVDSVASPSHISTNSFSVTVPAGTTFMVCLITLANDAFGLDLASASSSVDGALTVVSANQPANDSNREAHGGFTLASLYSASGITAGAHTISYTVSGATDERSSAIYATGFYKNVDATTQIGVLDSFGEKDVDALTITRSITTQKANSLVVTGGTAQGEDADPFVALHSATLITTGVTGGGSNTFDLAYGIASKIESTAAAHNAGFSWAVSDGHGLMIFEIRGP